MASQYHSLFTEQGLVLLREAIQTGAKLGITHMSYGDGNGVLPVPDASFTKMVKEVYRTPLNRLAPSKENLNWLEADGVIPSAVGGFNIREVGLWAGNVMIAYANYPPTYKPSADQGTAQIKTIRIVLQIDNTANFELKIDTSVVMATIQSMTDAIKAITGGSLEDIQDSKVVGVFPDGSNQLPDFHNKLSFTVDSILALKALKPIKETIVSVKSYYENKNIGGGDFKFIPDSVADPDEGLIIKPLTGSGRWHRTNTNNLVISPFLFGAIGDFEIDDNTAIVRAQNAARALRKGVVIDGFFASSETIVIYSGDTMKGNGKGNSRIKKITNNNANLEPKKSPEVLGNDSYNVDALVIIYPPDDGYAGNIRLSDIYFQRGNWGVDDASTYGLYCPRLSSSIFENLQFDNVSIALRSMNLYLNRFVNFTSIGKFNNGYTSEIGMLVLASDANVATMTGTSNTFERMQFVNFTKGFSVCGMQYTVFQCCTAEVIENAAATRDAMAFEFYDPRGVTLISCGVESSYACTLYLTNTDPNITGTIKVQSFNAAWGINGTKTDVGMNILTATGNIKVMIESSWIRKSGDGFLNKPYITNGAEVKYVCSSIGDGTFTGTGKFIEI